MKLIVSFLAGMLLLSLNTSAQGTDGKMKIFIDGLMKKMTLAEKLGQLNLATIGFNVTGPLLNKDVEGKIKKGLVGAVFNTYTPIAVRKLQEIAVKQTRLGIPLLFGFDVIHGHHTIFPIPLGLSTSWDTLLIRRTARAAADEASADGLNWTFSPMVDIARDPRWGRVSEGAGEDPFLGSQIAKAMVRGYQGNDLTKNNNIMACVKHFALYGGVEAGRDYNVVDMSPVKMYNDYLPPYKAAVEAGVATVMTSFNEVNGVPAAANKWLITDLLRKQWGFKGFVVTDYTAVNELIMHGIGDTAKAGELALNAGTDLDMVDEVFITYGKELVKSGRVSMATIDAACRRILEAKYKWGLFANPYKYVSDDRNKSEMMSADKLELSREAAEKSIVLLKNKNGILPLHADQKIAFIGPLVKDQHNLIGNWNGAGKSEDVTSIWMALEQKYAANKYSYSLGANLVDDTLLINQINPHGADIKLDIKSPSQLIDDAVQIANQSDVIVAVLGESFLMSGEAASRSDIGLLSNQVALLKALKRTGKPIVLVLLNGRPLTLQWEDDNMDAILECWFPGTKGGTAITNILFGDANPSGKITMTFPRSVGQVPIYYNHRTTGRPIDVNNKYTSKYLDISNEPLYPFGYGLSYTTFSYGEIKIDNTVLENGKKIRATVVVTNTGKVPGTETVQLYTRQMIGSVTRPVKELKGFQKVNLNPGESKTITFTITPDDLKFYNAALKYAAEPGKFMVYIGSSSRDVKEASFTLRSK